MFKYLEKYMEYIWNIYGIYLEYIWKIFGRYLENIWKIFKEFFDKKMIIIFLSNFKGYY